MKPTKQPEATEKPTTQPEGTERHRDEQRTDGGPAYGGEDWKVADERGENRFGHARNDDADPSELKPGESEDDDTQAVSADEPEPADAEQNRSADSSGQQAGMGRGEKPRKDKQREK
jgi:hypothetical protein